MPMSTALRRQHRQPATTQPPSQPAQPPMLREPDEKEMPLSEAEIAQGVREGIFRAPAKRRDMRAAPGMPYVTKTGGQS